MEGLSPLCIFIHFSNGTGASNYSIPPQLYIQSLHFHSMEKYFHRELSTVLANYPQWWLWASTSLRERIRAFGISRWVSPTPPYITPTVSNRYVLYLSHRLLGVHQFFLVAYCYARGPQRLLVQSPPKPLSMELLNTAVSTNCIPTLSLSVDNLISGQNGYSFPLQISLI